MATRTATYLNPTTGQVGLLPSGDKLGGITGGGASGEVLTYDQVGSVAAAHAAIIAAIAALSSNGIIARTASGTVAARTITGTANQVSVSNGDGVSGNPTLSLPQDINDTASVTFANLSLSGGSTSQITLPNRGQRLRFGTASCINETLGGAALVLGNNISGSQSTNNTLSKIGSAVNEANYMAYRYDCGLWFGTNVGAGDAIGTEYDDTHKARLWIGLAGNIHIGGTLAIPSGATANVVFSNGSTSPVLGAATADCVSEAAVDNGAGNREIQWQPELGGYGAYGNDHFRMVPSVNHKTERGLIRGTTTNGTATTLHTIAIPTDSTVMITSRFIALRTGGSSGTAGDYASYWITGTYTNIAGTVTCRNSGAVPEAIQTAVEAQAGWDATQTISGTNVLERVTGATNNNVSWSVESFLHQITG